MSELVECIDGLTAEDIIKSIVKTANGLPFYLQTSAGGFCAEYQRIYDDLAGSGTPPGDAIAATQNTMVCGLVADGVWAKLDIFYLFAQTTNAASEALMNWVTTGLYNAVIVPNGGALTFTALEGFTGDGAAYINTGYNPTDHGVNFIQDSASFGYYARTVGPGVMMGTGNVNSAAATLNSCNSKMNDTTWNDPVPGAPAVGIHIYNRLASTTKDVFINKTKYSGAIASTGLPLTGIPFYVLAYNNNGGVVNICAEQCSMAFTGSGLTQANVDDLTDRVETYMDSNGKGVIP